MFNHQREVRQHRAASPPRLRIRPMNERKSINGLVFKRVLVHHFSGFRVLGSLLRVLRFMNLIFDLSNHNEYFRRRHWKGNQALATSLAFHTHVHSLGVADAKPAELRACALIQCWATMLALKTFPTAFLLLSPSVPTGQLARISTNSLYLLHVARTGKYDAAGMAGMCP
jgi:hypothetical protein